MGNKAAKIALKPKDVTRLSTATGCEPAPRPRMLLSPQRAPV